MSTTWDNKILTINDLNHNDLSFSKVDLVLKRFKPSLKKRKWPRIVTVNE